jgi:hypothetical protein
VSVRALRIFGAVDDLVDVVRRGSAVGANEPAQRILLNRRQRMSRSRTYRRMSAAFETPFFGGLSPEFGIDVLVDRD